MSELYIVYNLDTEGPLYESLSATFQRISDVVNKSITPSNQTLKSIQNGDGIPNLNLGKNEKEHLRKIFSPKNLQYNDDWRRLDLMWNKCLQSSFREQQIFKDDVGRGLIYNFFVLDFLGFSSNNPRRRCYGVHNIFDYYKALIDKYNTNDKIYWHFHPMHYTKSAHLCGNSLTYSWDIAHELIARLIIEKNFYPTIYRAGCHTERQDSHHFLESWVPFDYSNQSQINNDSEITQKDTINYRFADWRRAPSDWSIYHPDHYDYQLKGSCRRYLAKCLNIGTRARELSYDEIKAAFENARQNKRGILSFVNHDFRDVTEDLILTYDMIKKVKVNYPDVKIINMPAGEAIRNVIFNDSFKLYPLITQVVESESDNQKKVKFISESGFHYTIEIASLKGGLHLSLTVTKGETFGSQPFLAVKTIEGHYWHDNFDVEFPFSKFHYTFDNLTFPLKILETVGIGMCDKRGYPYILKLDIKNEKIVGLNSIKVPECYY